MDELPPPFIGFTNNWAYVSLKDRIPTIIVTVVDSLCRHKDEIRNKYGEVGIRDIKSICHYLSELRNELTTNKKLRPLRDSRADVAVWNKYLIDISMSYPKCEWFSLPWLQSECYMYRRIQEAVELSENFQKFDVFKWHKIESLKRSTLSMQKLVEFMRNMEVSVRTISNDSTQTKLLEMFRHIIKLDLWGNSVDLSLSGGSQTESNDYQPEQIASLDCRILDDQTNAIYNYLFSKRQAVNLTVVHMVVDNAGYELFTDLCLADFLIHTTLADKIHFHLKPYPWFVSDAVCSDFTYLLDEVAKLNADGEALSKKWNNYIDNNKWKYSAEDFWNYPFDNSEMNIHAPALYKSLSAASLIIFKGDLNYRKLTGDLEWNVTTPFATSLRKFKPAPVCAIRTLKSDPIVGISEELSAQTAIIDEDWKNNGKWAVIQFTH